jgi:hypothetical protein
MHGASLGEAWADRAFEEAGLERLDNMATAEERLQTLSAIRMVTRSREKYWLKHYMERIVEGFEGCGVGQGEAATSITSSSSSSSSSSFPSSTTAAAAFERRAPLQYVDCVVRGPAASQPPLDDLQGRLYQVLALQLGSMHRYFLWEPSPEPLGAGHVVRSRLVHWPTTSQRQQQQQQQQQQREQAPLSGLNSSQRRAKRRKAVAAAQRGKGGSRAGLGGYIFLPVHMTARDLPEQVALLTMPSAQEE